VLLIAVCTLALLSPLVAGRWPAGVLLHRWRWPALIWLALAVQVVMVQASLAEGLASAMHLGTYAVAAVFLWLNREVAGVLVVGLGALSNGGTIALNGGSLPASADAVAAAGLDHGEGFSNSAVLSDPVLPWLGDVFAWPEPLPLANTFSVGDVLIAVGVTVAAWSGTRRLGRGVGPDGRDGTPAPTRADVDS
jgi:hypothetical protein